MRLEAWALIAAGGLLVTSSASSQQPTYPPEVQAVLDWSRRECRDQGGSDIVLPKDAVRKIDLTGDKRDDYIVSMDEVECAGSQSVFCGTGGCNLTILVALKNGTYRTVFDDRVRSFEISKGPGARTIRFDLHGSYCGGFGAQPCPKKRRITAKPFKFVMPQ